MSEPTTPPSDVQKLFFTQEIIKTTAKVLQDYDSDKPVTIIYHNDTDGLTSGTIMTTALQRIGRQVIPHCMEQIYPVPMAKIYENASGPIIFMDLGINEPQENFIRQQTRDKPTIIIDHHGIFRSTPKITIGKDNVFDVNCNKYGIGGDRYASASTLTYIFANKLAQVDDLSNLAVLGAVSDRNHMSGEEKGLFSAKGLDHTILAASQNVRMDDGIFKVKLKKEGDFLLMEQVVDNVTLLGSAGYRKKGADLGIDTQISGPELAAQLLTAGYNAQTEQAIKHLSKLREVAYDGMINRLREGDYTVLDNIFFFDVNQAFQGMGVKTIGSFCNYLITELLKTQPDFIGVNNYILGAQPIEPIPFGDTTINAFDADDVLKISVRTPRELQDAIEDGTRLTVAKLLDRVTPNQVSSTHDFRGSTVIPRSNLKEFLKECETCIRTRQTKALYLPELDFHIER